MCVQLCPLRSNRCCRYISGFGNLDDDKPSKVVSTCTYLYICVYVCELRVLLSFALCLSLSLYFFLWSFSLSGMEIAWSFMTERYVRKRVVFFIGWFMDFGVNIDTYSFFFLCREDIISRWWILGNDVWVIVICNETFDRIVSAWLEARIKFLERDTNVCRAYRERKNNKVKEGDDKGSTQSPRKLVSFASDIDDKEHDRSTSDINSSREYRRFEILLKIDLTLFFFLLFMTWTGINEIWKLDWFIRTSLISSDLNEFVLLKISKSFTCAYRAVLNSIKWSINE